MSDKGKDNNAEYWKKRAAWNMYEYMEKAEDTADEIAKLYQKASGWLSYQAKEVFDKYMKKHRLSETDARRLLSIIRDKTSIRDMITALKNGDFANKAELIAELESPAYQARIEHFRQLQNQLDWVIQEIYKQEKSISTSFYTDLANEAYYRSMFEIQKRAGLEFSFAHVSSRQIDKVLSAIWSGEHYSARIWKNTQELAKTLKQEMLVSLVTGRTERETAELIANKFGQGSMQARRLVRTESNYVSGQLNLEAYRGADVEEYIFIATLDLRTSEVCRELDGKIFKVSEAQAGVNHNPMHPWCRSTTGGVVDRKYLNKMTTKARDPSTGKIITIPATMTYQQWYDKYVRGKTAAENKEKMIRNSAADRKQYEKYKEILGTEMPDSFVKFRKMKYNDTEKWNAIKSSFRRKSNGNTAFSSLAEPLQLKHVRNIISDMGIDYKNVKIKIVKNPDLIGKGYFGWTNPNAKEIQLYPDAFFSREELVKTLGHERVHLEQFRLFGPAQNDTEAVYYEKGPRFSEQYWWEEYRRLTNYDGK